MPVISFIFSAALVLIESRYLKSDIMLEYFEGSLPVDRMNALLHTRTDSILDLVKEETIHDFFHSSQTPASLQRQDKMGAMATLWFDVIKQDVLKHEVADHMDLTPG